MCTCTSIPWDSGWGHGPGAPCRSSHSPSRQREHLLCARHVLVLGCGHSAIPMEANTRENITRTDGMWGLGYKGTEQDIQWSSVGQGSLSEQMGRG